MGTGMLRRRDRLSGRLAVFLALTSLVVWACWWLSRVPGHLAITEGGLAVASTLLARAFTPALTYESPAPD